MNPRRMILCLGPHRSGTSTVAAALAVLGADLRLPGVYANDENAKGFFEHPELVALNESLLAELGGAWDAPGFDGAAAVAADPGRAQALRARAVDFLIRTFAGADLAAMKDPRLCLLLPLWLSALKEAGFGQVLAVHVLRDPVEAALSQRSRQARNPAYYQIGADLGEGAALWLSYSAQMWEGFGAARHLVLGYDRLLSHPGNELARLAGFLGQSPDKEKISGFAKGFLDKNLRRALPAEADRAAVAEALPQAGRMHEALDALSARDHVARSDIAPLLAIWRSPATRTRIDALTRGAVARLSNAHRQAGIDLSRQNDALLEAERRAEAISQDAKTRLAEAAQDRDRRLAELAAERDQRLSALEADRDRRLAEMEADRDQRLRALDEEREREVAARRALQAEIDGIKASRSWRLTAPLRAAGRIGRRGKGALARGWVGFHHLGRRAHRGLERRAPGLAWVLYRALSPLFRATSRSLLGRETVPSTWAAPVEGAAATRQLAFQRPPPPSDFGPLVSVIVPNYNHAPYLRQRLETIYAQGWTNFEVLLLDDASTDGSQAILSEYAARYPDRTRLFLNERNSGGAFFQWQKGMAEARGDLVWIAESDDWCDANFLETLVPFFANPAVQLAFAPSLFMNEDGSQQVWSTAEYLAGIGPGGWDAPFVVAAPQAVAQGFAERNLIANVSSALMRRIQRIEVLEPEVWRGMRTCGDWVFYLNLLRGGMLAYSPATRNYYRQHEANISVQSHVEDRYYAEHEVVARTVQRHYRVPAEVFDRLGRELSLHWRRRRGAADLAELGRLFSSERIAAEAALRRPHLLMAGYAFCAGGGETFPINLANLMKTAGYSVTWLDCGQEAELPGIRAMLAGDIPVVSNFEDLTGILSAFDIEVIHSHHAWVDSTILDLLPEDSPVGTVVTLHGMYETIPEGRLRTILPRLARRTGRLVYIAEKNIEALTTRGLIAAEAMARIDNALPRLPLAPVPRADLGIPEGAFVLTLVSRAFPPKGWAEAIDAVTRARVLSGREVHLILVGEGEEYDRLKPGATPFIHFTGFRPNPADYFATADMGFLPSRFRGESFPLVLIECLNAGRPMLASDLGEVRAMLTGETGLAGEVFALEDWQVPVAALAARIAHLASHPEEVAAMAARVAEVAPRFDPGRMRDAYDRVYRDVAGRRGERAGEAVEKAP